MSVFVRSTFTLSVADDTLPQSLHSIPERCSFTSVSEDSTEDVQPLPPLSSIPNRTLRRRKQFSLSKQMPSSASLKDRMLEGAASIITFPKDCSDMRSRTPEHPQSSLLPSPPASPTRSTASSQSGNNSRPLYAAIRKTFHSGNVISLSPGSPRSISPCEQPGLPERSISPLTLLCAMEEEGSDESLPQGVSPYAHDHGRSMSGCSLSGETELRMALSRRRRNTVTGAPDYSFRERTGKQGVSFMLTVKKISHGFKSLVKPRA
jgi:hypothetical protein